MSELKPCPFCGATPMLYDLLDTHGGFSIECDTVGCDTEKMKRTKVEAIEAWNRRTQPAQVPTDTIPVPVEALTRWRDAFAEELAAWDIDPPLHHVKTSHDEIDALLAAAPQPKGGE